MGPSCVVGVKALLRKDHWLAAVANYLLIKSFIFCETKKKKPLNATKKSSSNSFFIYFVKEKKVKN